MTKIKDFVCVEFLRPSQPNRVMSSAVSLPNHTFTGHACAHYIARNWQLPFLNQRKGENDRKKYFMINLYERMLPTSAGVEPATSWSPVGQRIQLSHRGRPKIKDKDYMNIGISLKAYAFSHTIHEKLGSKSTQSLYNLRFRKWQS